MKCQLLCLLTSILTCSVFTSIPGNPSQEPRGQIITKNQTNSAGKDTHRTSDRKLVFKIILRITNTTIIDSCKTSNSSNIEKKESLIQVIIKKLLLGSESSSSTFKTNHNKDNLVGYYYDAVSLTITEDIETVEKLIQTSGCQLNKNFVSLIHINGLTAAICTQQREMMHLLTESAINLNSTMPEHFPLLLYYCVSNQKISALRYFVEKIYKWERWTDNIKFKFVDESTEFLARILNKAAQVRSGQDSYDWSVDVNDSLIQFTTDCARYSHQIWFWKKIISMSNFNKTSLTYFMGQTLNHAICKDDEMLVSELLRVAKEHCIPMKTALEYNFYRNFSHCSSFILKKLLKTSLEYHVNLRKLVNSEVWIPRSNELFARRYIKFYDYFQYLGASKEQIDATSLKIIKDFTGNVLGDQHHRSRFNDRHHYHHLKPPTSRAQPVSSPSPKYSKPMKKINDTIKYYHNERSSSIKSEGLGEEFQYQRTNATNPKAGEQYLKKELDNVDCQINSSKRRRIG